MGQNAPMTPKAYLSSFKAHDSVLLSALNSISSNAYQAKTVDNIPPPMGSTGANVVYQTQKDST